MAGPWGDYKPAEPAAGDGPWNDYAPVKPPKSSLIRRGIGDTLERTLGLQPEVSEAISREIDEALSVLAEDLRKMAGG